MTYKSDRESAANCSITLINQANYLLDRQLAVLQKDLVEKGDLVERYKQSQKTRLLGNPKSMEEFLRQQGWRRLEDGRMVKDE